ncbi:hypothetical protein [Glutamicibacter sp.]|jgi:hypothetical protein|uniref:hypothetical protein n=1 Tax=Glutamicibacter sp. TaxID=1931995 RepID=UPI002FD94152
MAVIQAGASTNLADVDANLNLKVDAGLPALPSTGGYYTVSGGTSAVVAVSLATDTSLMSMRFSSATRKAYLYKYRLIIAVATVGTSALVAGSIGLQRFTAATPTGGTARTPQENNETATATEMTDVRDNNAALTVTSVVFGAEIGRTILPLFISGGAMWFEWIFEPIYPIVLANGDGIVLRTRVVMPATQTWLFAYTAHWKEA